MPMVRKIPKLVLLKSYLERVILFKEKTSNNLDIHFFYSAGLLGKTNVPNTSTIRSIEYNSNEMRVFKASKIGSGVSVPYKKINFETNIQVISSFSENIDDAQAAMASKK